MTLILREPDVAGLVTMRDAVDSVERCFAQMTPTRFANTPRSRSIVNGAALSAMHASLHYLGRGGAKVYLSSKTGSQFAFLLFDLKNGGLLSVMGADLLGRYIVDPGPAIPAHFPDRAGDAPGLPDPISGKREDLPQTVQRRW